MKKSGLIKWALTCTLFITCLQMFLDIIGVRIFNETFSPNNARLFLHFLSFTNLTRLSTIGFITSLFVYFYAGYRHGKKVLILAPLISLFVLVLKIIILIVVLVSEKNFPSSILLMTIKFRTITYIQIIELPFVYTFITSIMGWIAKVLLHRFHVSTDKLN